MSADGSPLVGVLHEVRELIRDPERRCRHFYALDACGSNVSPGDDRAVRWCLIGALSRVASGTPAFELALLLLAEAAHAGGRPSLTWANDNLPHVDVLALVDAAIARAR